MILRLAAAVVFLLAFNANAAEVYRCVTENGVVRYSDKPCTDGKADRLDIENKPTDPDAVRERNRERAEQVEAFERADEEADNAAADAAKKKQERETACAAARERLAGMLTERRMYRENNGEREYFSSDEIVKRRQEQQDKVNELCGE